MAHVFKPGDRAYWIEGKTWIELKENDSKDVALYPLKNSESLETFTKDGRQYSYRDIILLPLNPYDPTDPNNPPEFRWPFMLNGRPVKVGDELHNIGFGKTSAVVTLYLEDDRQWCRMRDRSEGELSPKYFCWPDELPTKKKVAKWVYPICGIPGTITVGFTEEMTEEEARKSYGSGVQMIPGTEREVEL